MYIPLLRFSAGAGCHHFRTTGYVNRAGRSKYRDSDTKVAVSKKVLRDIIHAITYMTSSMGRMFVSHCCNFHLKFQSKCA